MPPRIAPCTTATAASGEARWLRRGGAGSHPSMDFLVAPRGTWDDAPVSPGRVCARRVLVCVILGGAIAGSALARVSNSGDAARLVPGDSPIAGRSYSHWEEAYLRWQLTMQLAPHARSCFRRAQRGPVWFLDSGFGPATFTCQIPSGRYAMMQLLTVGCSTIEAPPFHASSNAGLERCAGREWRAAGGYATLTLDGTKLRPPGYVRATTAFRFRMPARHNLLRIPGKTSGRTAAVGMSAIIPPLSPGRHTLTISSGFRNARPSRFPTITYILTTS